VTLKTTTRDRFQPAWQSRPCPSRVGRVAILIVLLLLAAGESLGATGRRLGYDVSLPGPARIEQDPAGRTRIVFPGAVAREGVGGWDLPAHDVTIVLPPGTIASGVSIEPVSPRRLADLPPPHRIAPLVAGDGGVVAVPPDTSTWGRLLGTGWRHGIALAHVRLLPARWEGDDDGGELVLAERFRVTVLLADDPDTHPRPRRRRRDPARELLADGRIVNPEALDAYLVPELTSWAGDAFAPTSSPSLEGTPVSMVIVTTDELAEAFQQLADHKTARGVPTVVRTISWIRDHYPMGEDLPATIREFLTDAYNLWGTEFVLLGGDVDVVPTRMLFSSFYPTGVGTEIPADCYYAGLDGDWNADHDAVPGEPYISSWDQGDGADLEAELLVGRAPVRTPAEVDVFTGKVQAYEQDDVNDRLGRILFMSEVLFPSDYSPGDTIADDGAAHSEEIISSILASQPVTTDRYYESYQLWPGSVQETKSGVMAAMNSGNYGLVNHIGHGFFYDMSVGDGTLQLPDASSLVNDHLFILNNLNCASAAIDVNCILERFVTNPAGGAVASIGLSRAAFPTTASKYQRIFFQAIYYERVGTLGEAVERSKQYYVANTASNTVERWTHLTMELIGDPSLQVWSRAPAPLVVSLPDTLAPGAVDLPVAVTGEDGLPVTGATVCASQPDGAYAYGLTDATGQAVLPLTLLSDAPVTVTVTAPDAVPVVRTLPVSSAPPILQAVLLGIRDDGTGSTVGNGDGRADSGETVALDVALVNVGGAAMSSPLSVTIASPDGVQILSTYAWVPALAKGDSVSLLSSGILVSLPSSWPDRTDLHLELDGDSGEIAYHQSLVVPVTAPRIVADQMTWNDYPYGDGDGVPEANEPIRVSFSVRNEGWGATTPLTGKLQSSLGVTIFAGDASWQAVPSLGTAEMEGEFLVSFAAIDPIFEAVLEITDEVGHSWTHRFHLIRPDQVTLGEFSAPAPGEAMVTWVPLQDDELRGYYVYRSLLPNGPWDQLTLRPITSAFYHDVGLAPMTRYFYSICAVDSSGMLGRRSSTYFVDTLPGEIAGFPQAMGAETSSHIAVGDIDGDGAPEVVTAADAIYVWRGDGTELRDGDNDTLTVGPLAGSGKSWSPTGVSLGDLTADPGLEIVACCRTDKSVYVFQHDGTVAPGWPRQMSNWSWTAPTVGDVDGDGSPEVVVTNVNGITYAWHADGTELLDGDDDPSTSGVFHVTPGEWYSFASPALVDLDGDRIREIVFPTRITSWTSQWLYGFRADGSQPAGWPIDLGYGGQVLCSPAVGDVNQDGQPEIVFITEDDLLYVVDTAGKEVPPFPIHFTANDKEYGISCPSPALADVDGDGDLDIVAVSTISEMESELHVIDRTGVELAGWPQSLEGNSEASPIVGDVTGDGMVDIIFPVGGGDDAVPNLIYGFQGDGQVVKGFPLSLAGPGRSTPALADLDGDGDIELAYAGWGLAVHVWDLPGMAGAELLPWPTFQGTAQRTGSLQDPTITGSDGTVPPGRPVLLGNHPNPFNPATTIEFALPASFRGRVQLSIYDLGGRLVRTLVDGQLAGGRHTVGWRGDDARGRSLASGVYLYRLVTPVGEDSGRMVLVR